MAKFRYRMQNILDVKMKLESQAKIAYSAVKKVIKSNKLEFETNEFIIKNEEGDLQ